MCKYCDNIKEDEINSLERSDADLLGQQGVGTDLIIIKKMTNIILTSLVVLIV